MKRAFFISLFVVMGCALNPVGPLDSPQSTPISRGPANTQRYHLETQKSYAPNSNLNSNIYLGMESAGVRASWGRPELVEYAGHPSLGQQRWTYTVDIPTPQGYIRQKRVVYFERDRVVGWETSAQ